jgi:hypothetical protein
MLMWCINESIIRVHFGIDFWLIYNVELFCVLIDGYFLELMWLFFLQEFDLAFF